MSEMEIFIDKFNFQDGKNRQQRKWDCVEIESAFDIKDNDNKIEKLSV